MQDGNNSARLFRIDVLVRVPSRSSGTRLALAITNHRDGNVVGLVHDGAVSDSKTVAEFTAFVDRTGRLGVDLCFSTHPMSLRPPGANLALRYETSEVSAGHT